MVIICLRSLWALLVGVLLLSYADIPINLLISSVVFVRWVWLVLLSNDYLFRATAVGHSSKRYLFAEMQGLDALELGRVQLVLTRGRILQLIALPWHIEAEITAESEKYLLYWNSFSYLLIHLLSNLFHLQWIVWINSAVQTLVTMVLALVSMQSQPIFIFSTLVEVQPVQVRVV